MNKTQLIALAAENSGLAKKDAERVINVRWMLSPIP